MNGKAHTGNEGGAGDTALAGVGGRLATHTMDRAFRANLARMTFGITPAGLANIWFDWMSHLSISPGKQIELVEKAARKSTKYARYVGQLAMRPDTPACIKPMANDRRFSHPGWQQWPYNAIYQGFLLNQQWWYCATSNIDGLSPATEEVLFFTARQLLDRVAPSNFPWLNPEVTQATVASGGMNLWQGWQNFVEDWERTTSGRKPLGADAYEVGKTLGVTPGKVVYQNRLMELIQYAPTTDKVHAEPIMIVPAWIMKYYILDLSPANSLVKYLVDQGHTVFMISWRNPTSEYRDMGMQDYRQMGPMAALDVIGSIVPKKKVHAVGYCLGGTLMSIAAAAMARDGDDRLASLTTFAAQVDFTEAGELMMFIGDSQVSYLEDMMWDTGYLDGDQMAGAFQLLRSNDLIWSRVVHDYMLGKRQPMNDLMAWNADLTRMPYRMHSEYLRRLFLNNELARGMYRAEGRPVVISDIRAPIFAVGTVKDHVAPWHSVYKIHLLADTDEVTFLLTSGGHNAGIVSEPGHPHRSYQMRTHIEGDAYVDPDTWQRTTHTENGSWWPAWQKWLVKRSSGKVAPPEFGAEGYPVLGDAPGTYVLES